MTGRRLLIHIAAIIIFLTGFSVGADAQFREQAFNQSYNSQSDTTSRTDTTDKLFSFKDWAGGLAHKHEIKIGTMFAGSIFAPGTAQIYNKDYWKLPIIYGGIGATAGLGGYYLNRYNKASKNPEMTADPRDKTRGTLFLAGAGLLYWGSLMDGVTCYQKDVHPQPGRATIYAILLPGLGQIYNKEYWKVPIYWGCLAGSVHFYVTNNRNYQRFKRIHNEATNPDIQYDGPISAETAVWYRDVYRRYRDYSIVAIAGFYLLQILDANIFAYMHDFEVTNDLSMSLEPTVIAPDNYYVQAPTSNTVGLKLGFRF